MAIQPLPAHGTLNWDVPLNSILAQIGNTWYPSDQGWLAQSMDATQCIGSTALSAVLTSDSGDIHTYAVPLRQAATVTSITVSIPNGGAGVGLTAGQNFAGLYNSAGSRVGVTADQTTAWGTVGVKVMNLTAPVNLVAGVYYIALLANWATTAPSFSRGTADTQGPLNSNLAAASFRSAVTAGTATTLPTTITMGSRAASPIGWFGALA